MSNSKVEIKTLSNGLQIIGEPNAAHKSAGIGYFVKTGARDETAVESGLSHFLEHMMFKGTATRSAIDINFALGNIGAQANAFTSEENTVYYAVVIPECFKEMQGLLSDMLRPALAQEEFDTEKNVILEEIALYQDRPQFYLFENASIDFFSGHPAGNSVLGSTESISAMTSTQMRSYFTRRYASNNIALVASGNFNWNEFVSDAERLTADWKPDSVGRERPPFSTHSKGKVFKRKNLNQAHLLLVTPSCSASEAERYALSVLSLIVGDGSNSRFYWDLIDKGIAEAASAENDERDGCGVFSAYACAEPEKLDTVRDIISNILKDARNFSDAELARAKTKINTRIVMSGELPMGRLMGLGIEWNSRQRIHSLKEEIEKFKAVTRNDIERALEKYPLDKMVEYRLMPE